MTSVCHNGSESQAIHSDILSNRSSRGTLKADDATVQKQSTQINGDGLDLQLSDPLIPRDSKTISNIPRGAMFIMAQEFCERFSFYGMKTVLFVYLSEYHEFSDDTSTSIVHLFIAYAYTTPIIGGILSDSYWGKYKTILYLSLIYAVGAVTLAATSNKQVTGGQKEFWGGAIGLVLIGLGAGGITPCVSSFMGDQFLADQASMLQTIFASFYFIINAGSLASAFLSPFLREQFGFEYAFGVTATLLMIATFVFYLGRHHYRIVPVKENVLFKFYCIVKIALSEKYKSTSQSISDEGYHWLNSAKKYYDAQLVEDCKAVTSVLRIFLPIPVFWMLYDQVITRWTIQAEDMDRDLGSYTIPEDQVQILNPLMILALIPVFDQGIYPFMENIGLRLSMLTRIKLGMILSASSFIAAGFVQLAVENAGEGGISIFWQVPQYFLLSCSEIMVSITGIEFAYAHAPSSMKSIVMAAWHLTVAVGNVVVAIIVEVSYFDTVTEFFFFSGLMCLFIVLFFFISKEFEQRGQNF